MQTEAKGSGPKVMVFFVQKRVPALLAQKAKEEEAAGRTVGRGTM